MTYTPTVWKDHLTPNPSRYRIVQNPDDTILLIQDFGTPTQEGTPISAANMNKIEQGIVDAHDDLNGWRTYNTLAELGITEGSETMEQICTAMPDKSMLIWRKVTGNASTAYPANAGILQVKRLFAHRIELRFINGVSGAVNEWIGYYDDNTTPKFSGWSKVELNLFTGRLATNLNNETSDGWVWINDTTANKPGQLPWGLCRIETRSSTSLYQTALRTDTNDVRIFTRKLNGTTWSSWVEEWHSGNLPDPARTGQANTFTQNQLISKSNPRQIFRPGTDDDAHSGDLYQNAAGENRWLAGYKHNTDTYAIYDYVAAKTRVAIEQGASGRLLFDGNEVWDKGSLRYTSGRLEVYTGGSWSPVGGVKQVQRGSTTFPSDTNTTDIVIGAVNMSKSWVNLIYAGLRGVSLSNGNTVGASAYLHNSTTLKIVGDGSASGGKLNWEVIENY